MVTDPPYGINYRPNYKHAAPITGDDSTALMEWALGRTMPRVVSGASNAARCIPPGAVWWCWDKRCSDSADRMFGAPMELGVAIGANTKQPRMYRIQHGGVVNADGAGPRHHPTQKPVQLMRRLIADFVPPASVIIDPFMGSGSTLKAAQELGRECIGIDVEQKWCDVAAQRLADAPLFAVE